MKKSGIARASFWMVVLLGFGLAFCSLAQTPVRPQSPYKVYANVFVGNTDTKQLLFRALPTYYFQATNQWHGISGVVDYVPDKNPDNICQVRDQVVAALMQNYTTTTGDAIQPGEVVLFGFPDNNCTRPVPPGPPFR